MNACIHIYIPVYPKNVVRLLSYPSKISQHLISEIVISLAVFTQVSPLSSSVSEIVPRSKESLAYVINYS